MAKFQVTLTRTVVKTLTYEVSAKDNDTAREKVESMLEACDNNPEKIAKRVKMYWGYENDEIDIEINEL